MFSGFASVSDQASPLFPFTLVPEELQKVLFEQIDLRRRLEQEFQVLKGTASFPVFSKGNGFLPLPLIFYHAFSKGNAFLPVSLIFYHAFIC